MANNRTSSRTTAQAADVPSAPLGETMNQNGAQTAIDAIIGEAEEADAVMANRDIRESTIISARYNADIDKFVLAIVGDSPIIVSKKNTLVNALATSRLKICSIKLGRLLNALDDVDAINEVCSAFAGLPVTYRSTLVKPNDEYENDAIFNNLIKIDVADEADRESVVETINFLYDEFVSAK